MVELKIITGRAGAGKSQWVLDRMAARRGQCGQVLLVPEHATHEAELDLCRALGDTASRDGEVLSFQSLATRVLAQTGGLAEVTLDNGGKILTMRRALQEPDRPSVRRSCGSWWRWRTSCTPTVSRRRS